MSPWIPFFYYYGLGGLFFALSLWASLRIGGSQLKLRRDRIVLLSLVGGLSFFFLLHFVWILIAGAEA